MTTEAHATKEKIGMLNVIKIKNFCASPLRSEMTTHKRRENIDSYNVYLEYIKNSHNTVTETIHFKCEQRI